MPGRTIKGWAAALSLLVGAAFGLLIARTWWRVGLPLPYQIKPAVYVWFATIAVAFPISFGLALLRAKPSWGSFAGWWLLAAGVIFPGSLLPALPHYRDFPATALCTLLCALPPVQGGCC
jgi:hypothetical protein